MTATKETFAVNLAPGGAFVLVGSLDMDTLPQARDLVEEFRVRGRPVVLDLAGITFLDTMTIHWLVELSDTTDEAVVLRNVPDTCRLVLAVADILGSDGAAWVLDDTERHAPA